MKKIILILSMMCIAFSVTAQNKYEKGMQKAFQLMKDNKNTEAANLFERISEATPTAWLPAYYAAQINILDGFAVKDKSKLTQQMEKAQKLLDHASEISPNNPELMIMQAMLYTVWVAFDGATYGMKYAGKVSEIYGKALDIAPNNPRVLLCKNEWDMGSAKYFGKDTAPYCKAFEIVLEQFEIYKAPSDFHPSWGKDRAEYLLAQCKQ